jgi:hypothetical protein
MLLPDAPSRKCRAKVPSHRGRQSSLMASCSEDTTNQGGKGALADCIRSVYHRALGWVVAVLPIDRWDTWHRTGVPRTIEIIVCW